MDESEQPKSPKERVTQALKNRRRAEYLRLCRRDTARRGDQVLTREYDREVAIADKAADEAFNRWNYTTANPQRGNGGELVPLPDQTPEGSNRRQNKVNKVEEPADVLAHQASSDRMDLLIDADALAMGIHLAETMKPKGQIQRMLLHQLAALHTLGMRFAGKAEHEMTRIKEASVFSSDAKRQLACVEAARMMNAAARAMSAFNDGALALQRLRTGGKQVVQVQHITVAGGQAVVAQNVKTGRRGRGSKQRGAKPK